MANGVERRIATPCGLISRPRVTQQQRATIIADDVEDTGPQQAPPSHRGVPRLTSPAFMEPTTEGARRRPKTSRATTWHAPYEVGNSHSYNNRDTRGAPATVRMYESEKR